MAPVKPGKYEFSRENLVGLRQQLKLSQAKMATLLGVPVNTLSRWETGATTPDAESLASIHSVAMEHGITPNFFRKRRPMPKQSQKRSRLLVTWDFQNLGLPPATVSKADKWLRSELSKRLAATSYSRFKAFAHPSQTAATDELQTHGWRVWEDDEDMDEEIIRHCKSDCGQEPKDTLLVFITKDGGFAGLVEDLKAEGVVVYMVSPSSGSNTKLIRAVGADHWIQWPKSF